MCGQLDAPATLPPGIHWIRGWVGPRAGLDDVERRKILLLSGVELDTSAVQPVASRYTYCDLPAHCVPHNGVIFGTG
jgi:hypothetical protein